MAPTELLAEQHLAFLRSWLEPLGIGSAGWRARCRQGARRGHAGRGRVGRGAVVVGTHALMQEGVEFHDLGLVIVDEQHRFGVHQRLALRDKGLKGTALPHQLVMTATPIPRTLAMTAYADLDVSLIDELPPGRTPVTTGAWQSRRRDELVERVRAACAEGRQAYWVCTLIEESDDAARRRPRSHRPARLRAAAQLPELRIGLVHGRMKAAQKQSTMRTRSRTARSTCWWRPR
jgi:ATP-dependent DNA helicase RecG